MKVSRIFFATMVMTSISVGLFYAPEIEARVGGGRSFGSRGSRGFSQRSYSQPNRPSDASRTSDYQQQRQPLGNTNPMGYNNNGSSFLRNMAGGLAGGFLGSMLFRNLGFAGTPGMGGNGGMGLFEILLVLGLCWFGYRWFMGRRLLAQPAMNTMNHADRTFNQDTPNISPEYSVRNSLADTETGRLNSTIDSDPASVIQKLDPTFNLKRFQEERMDDFFRIQSAWMNRDLAKIESILTQDFRKEVLKDLELLKSQGKINRLENIAVRDIQLIEAWNEFNMIYATLQIRANVVDYTIDEKSGNIVEGSKDDSIKFEEEWTFCRENNGSQSIWKLSAIQA